MAPLYKISTLSRLRSSYRLKLDFSLRMLFHKFKFSASKTLIWTLTLPKCLEEKEKLLVVKVCLMQVYLIRVVPVLFNVHKRISIHLQNKHSFVLLTSSSYKKRSSRLKLTLSKRGQLRHMTPTQMSTI
jgi:hypothetical protein